MVEQKAVTEYFIVSRGVMRKAIYLVARDMTPARLMVDGIMVKQKLQRLMRTKKRLGRHVRQAASNRSWMGSMGPITIGLLTSRISKQSRRLRGQSMKRNLEVCDVGQT